MKPVVALVGRPNVGKSTLFNRLTRSRTALVADIPGLTRDRQYGDGRVGDHPYLVVDTGGVIEALPAADTDLRDQIVAQTRQALTEADAVILLVDARGGVHPMDRALAADVRRFGKPIVLAANKAEGLDPALAVAEFHALGLGPPLAVSAAHGDGVEELIGRVLASLPAVEPPAAEERRDVPHIAVIGRPNAGKSTLVNALLGEPRVLVGHAPGTTRDSIRVPLERDGRSYVLIDTAGVRRRARIADPIEHYSVAKALQAIAEGDVAILVLDADAGVADQDAALAGYVLEQGRAMVIAANKWDLLDHGRRERFRLELERKLAFLSFAKVHTISALHGKGVRELFRSVDMAFASASKTLPTPRLTRILQAAIQANPPPRVRGRLIRPKYAHQGGKNPPRVVVHGNQVGLLSPSYRRYLSNAIREAFRLTGTPVLIECRQEENPYARIRHGAGRRKPSRTRKNSKSKHY